MTTAAVNALQVSSLLCKNTRQKKNTTGEKTPTHTTQTNTHCPPPSTPPTAEKRESRRRRRRNFTFSPEDAPHVWLSSIIPSREDRWRAFQGWREDGEEWWREEVGSSISSVCCEKKKEVEKRGRRRRVEGSEEEREKMSLEEA